MPLLLCGVHEADMLLLLLLQCGVHEEDMLLLLLLLCWVQGVDVLLLVLLLCGVQGVDMVVMVLLLLLWARPFFPPERPRMKQDSYIVKANWQNVNIYFLALCRPPATTPSPSFFPLSKRARTQIKKDVARQKSHGECLFSHSGSLM